VRLRLVVPADVEAPTGGNTYDLALADALRRDGDEVEMALCEPSQLRAVLDQPWAGHTLVDGLLACHQPRAIASAKPGVLVHLPLALEAGLSPDRATELDRVERQALRAATLVVATSHWSADYLNRHHGLPEVAVAPPGTEPAPLSAGSDPPLLVQLAALLPNKDQLGVVAALNGLTDLSWRTRLAGPVDRDPAYADAVRVAVSAAGLTDRVEIPGAMARDAAWAGADLALLPSRVETFGMVVTEALARGIPAVVSAGGAAEALGVTAAGERPGVVVPAGDTDALTRVLRRWLTNEAQREVLRSRALARRATLEGWETTAARVRQALTGG
jgi:glycosyltransferase involved in cell wall biosynthesis